MVEVMLAPIAIHTAACLAAPSPPLTNRRHGNTSSITIIIAWRGPPPPLRPLSPWQVSPPDSSTKHCSGRHLGVRHWQFCLSLAIQHHWLAHKGAHSWPRPPTCPSDNFARHHKSLCASAGSLALNDLKPTNTFTVLSFLPSALTWRWPASPNCCIEFLSVISPTVQTGY